jgi:hypothetical protein
LGRSEIRHSDFDKSVTRRRHGRYGDRRRLKEGTTPLAIGTAGSLNVVAAPTRSLWQTDTIALRMILRASWVMRASGHVQVINDVVW